MSWLLKASFNFKSKDSKSILLNFKIAADEANGYGLAMWQHLKIVSPQLLLNKVTNVDDKKYSSALLVGWN